MNNIKLIRTRLNMSQKTLAEKAGISPPYLFDLENNRRGAKQETLERIASALGVSVNELEGDEMGVSE